MFNPVFHLHDKIAGSVTQATTIFVAAVFSNKCGGGSGSSGTSGGKGSGELH